MRYIDHPEAFFADVISTKLSVFIKKNMHKEKTYRSKEERVTKELNEVITFIFNKYFTILMAVSAKYLSDFSQFTSEKSSNLVQDFFVQLIELMREDHSLIEIHKNYSTENFIQSFKNFALNKLNVENKNKVFKNEFIEFGMGEVAENTIQFDIYILTQEFIKNQTDLNSEIFRLKYKNDLKNEEIASRLNLNSTEVSIRINKLKKDFERFFAQREIQI